MRQVLLLASVVTLTAAALTAWADDSAAARALVDKGIEAHGGRANLAKFQAVTTKLKGTFHGLGEGVAVTGEVVSQGADQQRGVIEAVVGGEKLRIVQVLNRDKGWLKIDDDDTEELDKEDLAEAKEEAYADWVASLVPLNDKAFVLAPAGEVNINKQPAFGVKVSSKGRRDVNLYFDKMTGLLVKTETRVKDEDSGQEVTQETLLSDHKHVQGTRQPMRVVIRRDGKLYLEAEVTDCRLAQKLDDSVFARP